MESINNIALAGEVRKLGDDVLIRATVSTMTNARAGLSESQRAVISRVREAQNGLRRADGLVAGSLIRWLAEIHTDTPENVRFLEQAAAAAWLLPEERQKIGLK